jgi:hypothetical protein
MESVMKKKLSFAEHTVMIVRDKKIIATFRYENMSDITMKNEIYCLGLVYPSSEGYEVKC